MELGSSPAGAGGGPQPHDREAGTAPPGRLPSYHVPRPRLTGQCRDERIVILEAAAGYGKSVLAAELVNVWGAVPVEVLLEDGGVPARLFASRLRARCCGRVS